MSEKVRIERGSVILFFSSEHTDLELIDLAIFIVISREREGIGSGDIIDDIFESFDLTSEGKFLDKISKIAHLWDV